MRKLQHSDTIREPMSTPDKDKLIDALVEALEAAIPQTTGARYDKARAALDAARGEAK